MGTAAGMPAAATGVVMDTATAAVTATGAAIMVAIAAAMATDPIGDLASDLDLAWVMAGPIIMGTPMVMAILIIPTHRQSHQPPIMTKTMTIRSIPTAMAPPHNAHNNVATKTTTTTKTITTTTTIIITITTTIRTPTASLTDQAPIIHLPLPISPPVLQRKSGSKRTGKIPAAAGYG